MKIMIRCCLHNLTSRIGKVWGLFLIVYMSSGAINLQAQDKVDLYRANVPVLILHDMHSLSESGNLYLVVEYLPDIAQMIKHFVAPYPNFSFDWKQKKVKNSDYASKIEETFETLDPAYQLQAYASLVYFGGLNGFRETLDSLILTFKGKPGFRTKLEEVITLQACAGFYQSAKENIALLENTNRGDRTYMHLAVNNAYNDRPDTSYAYAMLGLSRMNVNFHSYETYRQLFHLCYILGKKQQKAIANELISNCPEHKHSLVAKAYLAYGLRDTTMLREVASACLNNTDALNYPLEEVGVIAAKLSNEQLALWCIHHMDKYSSKNAVRVYCALAKKMHSAKYLRMAENSLSSIPSRVTEGIGDATVWVLLASVQLDNSDESVNKVFHRVAMLKPHHRIRFALRFAGIMSQRYYKFD